MSETDEATEGHLVRPATFPPISQQIRTYQLRTGDSTHGMSRRSAGSGHQVTQRYIHDLARGKAKQWPRDRATFDGLADGIETTQLAIVLGFAAEFGVPVQMSEFATRLPPGVDELDERVKESILGVLWALCSEAPIRRYLPSDAELTDADLDSPDVISGPSKDEPGSSGQQ